MITENQEYDSYWAAVLRRQLYRYSNGRMSKHELDCVISHATDNLGMEAVSEITLMGYDELLDIKSEVKGL